MRYFISDYHFYNAHFVGWRGFSTVEEMNTYMLRQWNNRVTDADEVIILGDLSDGTGEETNALLRCMAGQKRLLTGNHDNFLSDPAFDRSLFAEITAYKELSLEDCDLVLSHYPMLCYNGQYREASRPERKTYMLYGHVHHSFDETMINEYLNETRKWKRKLEGHDVPMGIPCNLINCFCRFTDYVPLSLPEWITLDATRREALTKRTAQQRLNHEITF